MSKYILKPKIVDAIQFKLGMEDECILRYSGNFGEYNYWASTMKEANDYIKNNWGKLNCSDEDKKYEIIYEDPVPCIYGYEVNVGDYIVTDGEGNKYVQPKDEFETQYNLYNAE